MKALLLFLSLISFSLHAQDDSLFIYQPDLEPEISEHTFLAQLPIQNIQYYDETEQVLIYADTLDFDLHLAWYDVAWFSTPLNEYLEGSYATFADIFFVDLTKDGRKEMIALFNYSEGRSGWQSGYYHQTQWAIVWNFTTEQCLGIIPVEDIYEQWWVVNSEVFDEEHAHLWENDQEPELEYDGENSFDAMEVSLEDGFLVLRPAEITEENEFNLANMSTCTYHIFWNEDQDILDYLKTCD